MFEAADSVWSDLTQPQCLAAHPGISEIGGHPPIWSEQDQLAVRRATKETLAKPAMENRRYEARFGHVFLIWAGGRTGDDVFAALRQRMRNDPVTEARVAVEEHNKDLAAATGAARACMRVSAHLLDTARGRPATALAGYAT